jgi:hypothetical protein
MTKSKAVYGTKSFAWKAVLRKLRDYAAAERHSSLLKFGEPGKWSAEHDEHTKHGGALGAISALHSTGLLTPSQYERAFALLKRINHAKVTRRPFVEMRRAA